MQNKVTTLPLMMFFSLVPNNRGDLDKKGRVWKMFSVKSSDPLSLIMGAPKKTSFHHLGIVDTWGIITLNKIRKANQSNFTITQSSNI